MQPDSPESGPDPAPGEAAVRAAAWLARRDRGLSAAEAGEFARWRAAHPRNDAEFARLEAAWREFDGARAVPELAEMAQRLDDRTRAGRRRLNLPVWAAAAAVAALVFTIGALELRPRASRAAARGSATYQVVSGTTRLLRLADGSVVQLRGDSEVRAEFTPAERRVRLVRGEAHFTVSKNAQRPFIVSAGSVAVRAVGTAFDVELGAGAVDVVVTEGRVRLLRAVGSIREALPAPLLVAGQRAVIVPAATGGAPFRVAVDTPAPGEIERALAWQSTWLIFDRTPLEDAAQAFNDYNSRRLVLGDPSLRGRQLGGRFRADNVEGFVRMLEQGAEVRAERRGENEIVLLPAR